MAIDFEDLKDRVEEDATNHVLVDGCESVFFQYKRPNSSVYKMNIVWIPGNIILTGDIGELVFVHYSAFDTAENAFRWLQHTDYDYLLSKSTAKKIVDTELSCQTIQEQIDAAEDWGWDDEEVAKLEDLKQQIEKCEDQREIPGLVYDSSLFDDWYGSETYSWVAHFQVRMLQKATKEWLDERE